MNKNIRLLVSSLWVATMSALLLIIASHLKFPTFDKERYGNIIIPLSLIIPLIFFTYSLYAYKTERFNKAVDKILLFGLVLGIASAFICTFGFRLSSTVFYPLVSTTDDPKNYLIIEDNLTESETELIYINLVFPNKIPDNATNVKYHYRCNSFWNYKLYAEWQLPDSEYLELKNKILIKSNYILSSQINSNSYEFEFDTSSYQAKIDFDDKTCTVSYEFLSLS